MLNRPLKKAHLLTLQFEVSSSEFRVKPEALLKYASARRFLPRLASGTFLTGLGRGFLDSPSMFNAARKVIHIHLYEIREPSWNIGRYIEITSPPRMTPRTTMINGSIRAVRLATALSTSSS